VGAENDLTAQDPNGKYVKIKFTVQASNQPESLLIQFIDVTDTVNYGKSKEHNQVLETVNAHVNHEIRNPLNAITTQIETQKALMIEI
jgi:signal transduction histidine kinase